MRERERKTGGRHVPVYAVMKEEGDPALYVYISYDIHTIRRTRRPDGQATSRRTICLSLFRGGSFVRVCM